MNRQVAVATYFTSLRLVNFRGFGDVILNLLDERGNIAQWTLLLGDNGVGKTTILQALAWMRPLPEEVPDSGSEEDVEDQVSPQQARGQEAANVEITGTVIAALGQISRCLVPI